jgi:hypothetical protein
MSSAQRIARLKIHMVRAKLISMGFPSAEAQRIANTDEVARARLVMRRARGAGLDLGTCGQPRWKTCGLKSARRCLIHGGYLGDAEH